MNSFFISNAMAAGMPAAQPDGTFSLIMLVAIFVLFYFMLIRPQNRRAKEHREMVANLKKGDEVVTTGGMLARVVNIDEQYIRISLAEGVEIGLQRNAVSAILPKGTLKTV
jgi:preprotein translocase subunit YajC